MKIIHSITLLLSHLSLKFGKIKEKGDEFLIMAIPTLSEDILKTISQKCTAIQESLTYKRDYRNQRLTHKIFISQNKQQVIVSFHKHVTVDYFQMGELRKYNDYWYLNTRFDRPHFVGDLKVNTSIQPIMDELLQEIKTLTYQYLVEASKK
jgi:hypothetical protein